MSNLTHLAGFMSSISLKYPDGIRILRLLATPRRLRYVQVRRWSEVGWVAIERNTEGNFIGFRNIFQKNREMDSEHWGGFFQGFLWIYMHRFWFGIWEFTLIHSRCPAKSPFESGKCYHETIDIPWMLCIRVLSVVNWHKSFVSALRYESRVMLFSSFHVFPGFVY